METGKLSPGQRDSFRRLLDDPSASVRQALLAQFAQLGTPAQEFLLRTLHDPNRSLAQSAAWYVSQLKFTDTVAEFRAFIQSLSYELESGALMLARAVNPTLDIGACCTALDKIAARCRELMAEPSSPRAKCHIINRVLFHEWGFRGNQENYTDPLNSLLDQVLIRRKGIPLSLSIVYLLVAERLGLELEPVGLPGHFLVGCFLGDTLFFIDPFERGVFRDPEDIFDLLRENNLDPQPQDLAPTSVRELLCRCCRNLVNHYHGAGDVVHARLFAGFVEEFESVYERHST